MHRMKALACTMPQGNKPECSGQVFIGIFFDGTGNNMQADYEAPPPEKRKHTNVVKLFQAFRDEPPRGYVRYYIPGVGTAFPEIGEIKPSKAGSAFAKNGEKRIIWGMLQLLNAPHRYVLTTPLLPDERARSITENIASATNPAAVRRVVLNTWQQSLQAALKDKKPRVEQINLSVFGFSRGAAEARTFVNWLYEVCKQENGGWAFAGIPIRTQFVGIFDTVASVGLANLMDNGVLAGHQSWADNTQEIHPAVEQCVHFVAGHEVRACFPLDSVRVKNSYPSNAMEVMYPGSHSDVGGGYAPGDLGVALTPDASMSVIPGINMYHEARKAGVPLKALDALTPVQREGLTPKEAVIKDFNAYLRDAAVKAGAVEEMHRQHMTYYFTYRFKHRTTFQQVAPYATASSARKADEPHSDRQALQMTQTALLRRLSLGMVNPSATDWEPHQVAEVHQNLNKATGLAASQQDKLVYEIASRMNQCRLTPAIETFCSQYVHDSMAGFINFGMDEYSSNGLGLAKYRTVFKGND
jgi:hypothetical protein